MVVQVLLQVSNADELPPNAECNAAFDFSNLWKCFFIQFSYPYFSSKMLFVQSSYDHYVITNLLPFYCLTYGASGFTIDDCSDLQQSAIGLYRDFYLRKLVPRLYRLGHSFWSISCSWHAEINNSTIYDSPFQQVPKNSGNTIRKVV